MVLIAALPLEGRQDQGVAQVLTSAMRLQLERLGTQTLLYATTDEAALVQDLLGDREANGEVLTEALMELFSGLNHDFLAFAGYTREQEEIQVIFTVADLGRGEILASATRRARIDFSLDEAMISTLREMLPRVEDRISEVAGQKAAEASAQAGAREREDTVAEPARAVQGEEPFLPYELSIGFSPFLPIAVANKVFSLSYAPFVYVSYRIPLQRGVLGVGLRTGLNIFDSEEPGVASYFRFLVPVGVDIRYTGWEVGRYLLFVRATAGAAINVSNFSALPAIAEEGLARILAQAGVGFGAAYAFSSNVGIAVDAMYETFVYFYREGSGGGIKLDWIMGLVPSVYLYARL